MSELEGNTPQAELGEPGARVPAAAGVLSAGVPAGERGRDPRGADGLRPGRADAAHPGGGRDLVKGAVRMRLRPRAGQPRTVSAAVRLMWAGAAAELAALITVIVTAASVRSAVLHSHQAARGPR